MHRLFATWNQTNPIFFFTTHMLLKKKTKMWNTDSYLRLIDEECTTKHRKHFQNRAVIAEIITKDSTDSAQGRMTTSLVSLCRRKAIIVITLCLIFFVILVAAFSNFIAQIVHIFSWTILFESSQSMLSSRLNFNPACEPTSGFKNMAQSMFETARLSDRAKHFLEIVHQASQGFVRHWKQLARIPRTTLLLNSDAGCTVFSRKKKKRGYGESSSSMTEPMRWGRIIYISICETLVKGGMHGFIISSNKQLHVYRVCSFIHICRCTIQPVILPSSLL